MHFAMDDERTTRSLLHFLICFPVVNPCLNLETTRLALRALLKPHKVCKFVFIRKCCPTGQMILASGTLILVLLLAIILPLFHSLKIEYSPEELDHHLKRCKCF